MNPELLVMGLYVIGVAIIMLVYRWACITQDREIDNPPHQGEKE